MKGRFQSLKCLRVLISDDPSLFLHVVQHIEVCVVLHNLLIADTIPEDWIDPEMEDVVSGPQSIEEPRSSIRKTEAECMGKKRRECYRDILNTP